MRSDPQIIVTCDHCRYNNITVNEDAADLELAECCWLIDEQQRDLCPDCQAEIAREKE